MLAYTTFWFLKQASAELRLVHCLPLSCWRPAEQLLHLSSSRLCSDSTSQAPSSGAWQHGRRSVLYCACGNNLTRSGVPGVVHPAQSFASQAHGAEPNYFDVLGM